jgi:F-type H+-transporting ATPase subunit b
MLIDWFTVAAQVINFMILVWLMKRYLYQPILHAIDAREKRIADELADAGRKKAEAMHEQHHYERKNREQDAQRSTLLLQASEEAAFERERLIAAARQEADELSKQRALSLRRDKKTLHEEIERRVRQEVFAIARKTLSDLGGASLEERMISVFAQRMRGLDPGTKDRLGEALSSAEAVVRTAFKLPTRQREVIQRAIHETFSSDITLRYETDADLIGGIELSAAGQKVAWSIGDYLDTLEESMGELIKA